MKIGDKVRLIHGKEQGRVVQIIDAKQVEVEIEDGFRIPILKVELVVVSSEESSSVSERESVIEGGVVRWGGIYLVFTQFNDQTYELNLVNDTSYKTYFVIGEEKTSVYKGVFSGFIEKESFVKLLEVNIKDFDNWPEFIIQLIFFSYGESEFRPALLKKIRFRSAAFFKSKKLTPVINKEGYLFRLDLDALKIDVKSMEENMSETKSVPAISIAKPSKEIDLHIEKLTDMHTGMSNTAMLALQLETFQKNLDNAFATNMDEIIFIHGVGNGVLKKEIHKILSSNKNIKFFQDAQKEKFGYGATLVRLK
jgi:dsDNA-specific endonuclease/ATPase MutS2